MIIVVRTYTEATSECTVGDKIVTRKVFRDDDLEGLQKFLDERSPIKGYEWHNLDFSFHKI